MLGTRPHKTDMCIILLQSLGTISKTTCCMGQKIIVEMEHRQLRDLHCVGDWIYSYNSMDVKLRQVYHTNAGNLKCF